MFGKTRSSRPSQPAMEEEEMHRFSFVRKPIAVLALAAAALLVAAGVAYATIPDSAGVIHGCYAKVRRQPARHRRGRDRLQQERDLPQLERAGPAGAAG